MKPETNPIIRFYKAKHSGKRSMRMAINAMRASCVGCSAESQGNGLVDRLEAGFKNEIRNCAVLTCPLHSFRPYQKEAA